MQKATIFNPKDKSLKARVGATRSVQQEFDNIQAAVKHSQTNGYDSAVGTQDELIDAFNITKKSLKEALNSLSLSDLEKAKNDNLLSFEEYKNLAFQKNKDKLEKTRSNQNQRDTEQSKGRDL